MAKGFTLSAIREDIRWQSDLEEAELRLTDDRLTKLINLAIAKYQTMVSKMGSPVYLQSYDTQTTPTDDTSKNWTEVDLSAMPTQFEDIIGIDIRVNDVSYELQSTTFSDRNKWLMSTNFPGVPEEWFLIGSSKLCVIPSASSNWPIRIWYVPEHQPMEGDNDIFDPIVAKGLEWVVWECIEDIAIRDNYPKLRYAARDRKAECEGDIIKSIGKRGRDKPNYRKNTRQRRLNRGHFRFFSNRYNGG